MSDLPGTYVKGFHVEDQIRRMKYCKFGNTGMKVSQLAFGTAGFSDFYGNFTLEERKASVLEAIKKGINYFDTAPYYGYGVSEETLGKCLVGIPRKAYYVATKVGRYDKDPKEMFDYSAKRVKDSIDVSLKRLGVEHIDVMQVHDIEFAPSLDIVLNEALPALQEAKKNGKIRFIGISGYPVSVLAECVKRSTINIDTILFYTRLSMLNESAKDYLPLFKAKNLAIVNAAVHCMGLLTDAGPQDWHPASQEIKDACAAARNYCQKQNVEIGKLALFHALQENGPSTTLVGINTLELLRTNLDVLLNGINPKEKEAYSQVKKILSKLKKTHWEGVELERYWKDVSQ